MSSLLLLVAFIILMVWLARRSNAKNKADLESNLVDPNSKSYAQGYWDGYRAHQREVSGSTNSYNKSPTHLTNSINTDSQNQYQTRHINSEVNYDHSNTYAALVETYNHETVTIDPVAEKAKRDLQNINTTLYVASFLLVAAVALFVGTALPEPVKFVGVWFITIAFYVVGLVLHKSVNKLRPAAVAFVGTGLALLPFTGIAMYIFLLNDAAACWLITSVIGLVAFIFAAMRLNSQVIAYLAIAFGVSLTTSSVAILHVGLIWYFVVLIIFGSAMTFIAKFKLNIVPDCFTKPIYDSNSWIVPLVILASLFAANSMTVRDYWIVALVSAFYYGAVAASSVKGRDVSIFITRLLASFSILLMAYDFSGSSWTAVGFALSSVGIIQVAISCLLLPKRSAGDNNNEAWLWIGLVSQLLAPLFILHETSWAPAVSGQLFVLLIVSFGVSYYLRRALVSVFGTISLAILPIIWCTNVIKPAMEFKWISIIFLVLAAASVLVRLLNKLVIKTPAVRPFILANFALFAIEALAYTAGINYVWGFTIWATAALLVYVLMYLERQPWLSVVANIMISIAIWSFIVPEIDSQWTALIFTSFASVVFAIRALTKHKFNSLTMQTVLMVNISMFIFESLVFTTGLELGWGLAIWLISTVLIYGMTYIEQLPILLVPANILFVISSVWFVALVKIPFEWRAISIAWIVFAVFYSIYWVLFVLSKKSYALYFWWSAVIIGSLVSLAVLMNINETLVIWAGISCAAVGSVIALEGWRIKKYEYIVVASVIATLGLQRILYIVAPDTNILVYTHWWSLVFVGLSYMYHAVGKGAEAKTLIYTALTIMTLFTGMCALGMFGVSEIPYQLIFIIEHVLLLIAGLVLSKKLFTIWGAVGAILAVLWMIKDYTYVMLAIVAFALIGAAILALIKQSKNTK